MRRSLTLAFALAALMAATLTAFAPAGQAAADDEVFRTRPGNTWGVAGLDPGSGNFQYFSPVFAFAQIGSTVYSGGKFTSVTNGASQVDQPYLAAFAENGQSWRSGFRPSVDWSVFALETDAAGNRLFTGGEFTGVDGDTDYSAFAALDPQTGDIDASFGVTVERSGANAARVHDLRRDGDWLYIAGQFTHITGRDGDRVWVQNLGRVSIATGVVDRDWRPAVTGGSVWEVTPDPARDRVLFGGLFLAVDGTATQGFAMVDDSDADLVAYDRDFGRDNFFIASGYIFASTIEVHGNTYVIGGQDHRTMLTSPDLDIRSSFQTNRFNAVSAGRGGDTQALAISGDTLFVACHCWGQVWDEIDDVYHDVRSVYAVDLRTGDLDTTFAPDFSGSSGPWALHIDSDDCLWVGTDATQSGQIAARGIVRLCTETNRASGATVSVSHPTGVDPSGLVDDDLVTNWTSAHEGAASGNADRPYIDVALSETTDIAEIVLWNRTDSDRNRLQDVHVWVSADPITQTNITQLRNNPDVFEYARAGDHSAKRTLHIQVNRTARYLRIQVDHLASGLAPDQINLTELAVFGTPGAVPPVTGITDCVITVNGTVATVSWTEDGASDQVIRRSVNGSSMFWRGRTAGTSFADPLRAGAEHTYTVETVRAGGNDTPITCNPNPVTTAQADGIELTSTRQTRERIVLHWTPREAVTIFRNGVEIASDNDGWYSDSGLSSGTSYTYRIETADGRSDQLVVSTS